MHLDSKNILEQNNTWLRSIQLIKGRSKVNLSQQLLECIENVLRLGMVKKGDILPSINQLSSYFDISRWTIEKVFGDLKKKGFIDSARGKCYYVSDSPDEKRSHVLLLLNDQKEFNTVIYKSFPGSPGAEIQAGYTVYNNNGKLLSCFPEKEGLVDSDFIFKPIGIDIQTLISKISFLSDNQLSMIFDYIDKISNEVKLPEFHA